jgi:iron complex transport system ATP-binding protein
MMTGEPLSIKLQDVGVWRDGRWILRRINWGLPAGACAAILGPNGSGKSTLARILACHLWPTEGDVRILEGEFGDSDLLELRRSIRLLQPAGPYDVDGRLTTRQVVLTGFFATLDLYDQPDEAMEQAAAQAIAQVGLAAVADHGYSTLSSGERLRALIARALVQRPRLLLLDEPTAGLDILAREQVLATIQGLAGGPNPPAIVIITHHVEELPPATSQVLLLSDGRVAAAGRPADVLTEESLSIAYRCPVQVRHSGGRYYLEVHPSAWERLLERKPTRP